MNYNVKRAVKRARAEERLERTHSTNTQIEASREADESQRPQCARCLKHSPRGSFGKWRLLYSHRCPHGEPCPSDHKISEHVVPCSKCALAAREVIHA